MYYMIVYNHVFDLSVVLRRSIMSIFMHRDVKVKNDTCIQMRSVKANGGQGPQTPLQQAYQAGSPPPIQGNVGQPCDDIIGDEGRPYFTPKTTCFCYYVRGGFGDTVMRGGSWMGSSVFEKYERPRPCPIYDIDCNALLCWNRGAPEMLIGWNDLLLNYKMIL